MTTSHQKEQAERKAYAGSTTGMTYHSRAITGLDLERSGRHAQHATVTGTKASVQYPRQPSGSPWSGEIPESIEPPIGIDVSYVEPCGEIHEIEENLKAVSSVLSPEDAAAATASTIPSSGAQEEPHVAFHFRRGLLQLFPPTRQKTLAKKFAPMKAVVKTEPKIEDFFQNTKSRRSFIAGEKAIAYDVDQLLTFERNWLASGLGRGEPRMAILVASWRRARDSFQRVIEALPAGELKDEMMLELQIRENAMDRLADQAGTLVERNGHDLS